MVELHALPGDGDVVRRYEVDDCAGDTATERRKANSAVIAVYGDFVCKGGVAGPLKERSGYQQS